MPGVIRQTALTIAAEIAAGKITELSALLDGMNLRPGFADPANPLIPFGEFGQLHFARIAVLDDPALGDLPAYGTGFPDAPIWLVFMADCDGEAAAAADALCARASAGLRQIFGHCIDPPGADLPRWIRDHFRPTSATYVNWVGRTVVDIRAEAKLHARLRALAEAAPQPSSTAEQTRRRLIEAIREEGDPPPAIPSRSPAALVANIAVIMFAVCILLVLSPILLLAAIPFVIVLRRRERTDQVIAPRPTPDHVAQLAEREDHDVTNQFTAFGSVKPGRFRLYTLLVLLWIANQGIAQLFVTGRLARVGTIHFARWIFFDDRRRLLFASSYDGSLDSYMDDFINKVAFGLNLIFSNGIGYPRTNWLILGGARHEQDFKNYIRRHQFPTEIWYKAYPGLTAAELSKNRRLRIGFHQNHMTEAEARQWLALI